MPGTLKKFCHISKYLETNEKKLYGILENLCMPGSLRPRMGLNGITFIIPQKSDIAKMEALATSKTPEEAVEWIQAHIIQDYLPSPDDWSRVKEDIPNGNRKRVVLKKVSGKSVFIEDDVEIQLEPAFITFDNRRKDQCIYRIVGKKGLTVRKNAEPAKYTYARSGPRPEMKRTGGGRPSSAAEFAKQEIGKYSGSVFISTPGKIENPLVTHLVTILLFLKETRPSEYQKLIPHMSPCIITSFTILIREMSGEAFNEWYNTRRSCPTIPVKQYHDFLTKASDEYKYPSDVKLPQLDTGITRLNFYSELQKHYSEIASVLKFGIPGDRLLKYHMAMYIEATCIIPEEQEIVAANKNGLRPMSSPSGYMNYIFNICQTILGDKSVFDSGTARLIDSSTITTMSHFFINSDVFEYKLQRVRKGDSVSVETKSSDGDITVLPSVAAHNESMYINDSISFDAFMPLIITMPKSEVDRLLSAIQNKVNVHTTPDQQLMAPVEPIPE